MRPTRRGTYGRGTAASSTRGGAASSSAGGGSRTASISSNPGGAYGGLSSWLLGRPAVREFLAGLPMDALRYDALQSACLLGVLSLSHLTPPSGSASWSCQELRSFVLRVEREGQLPDELNWAGASGEHGDWTATGDYAAAASAYDYAAAYGYAVSTGEYGVTAASEEAFDHRAAAAAAVEREIHSYDPQTIEMVELGVDARYVHRRSRAAASAAPTVPRKHERRRLHNQPFGERVRAASSPASSGVSSPALSSGDEGEKHEREARYVSRQVEAWLSGVESSSHASVRPAGEAVDPIRALVLGPPPGLEGVAPSRSPRWLAQISDSDLPSEPQRSPVGGLHSVASSEASSEPPTETGSLDELQPRSPSQSARLQPLADVASGTGWPLPLPPTMPSFGIASAVPAALETVDAAVPTSQPRPKRLAPGTPFPFQQSLGGPSDHKFVTQIAEAFLTSYIAETFGESAFPSEAAVRSAPRTTSVI